MNTTALEDGRRNNAAVTSCAMHIKGFVLWKLSQVIVEKIQGRIVCVLDVLRKILGSLAHIKY